MTALYKFIADPDVIRFLMKGVVKFTPIPELNDPSELSPNLITEEVAASLTRLRREGYSNQDIVQLRQQEALLQRLAPQFLATPAPLSPEEATTLIRSSFYDFIPRLERLLSETAREMSSKVGLFCLTLRYDSLPMWAHYASNASGLVVEFHNLDNIFPGDETGVLRQPISVRYDREHSSVTFDPQSHQSIFFSKFQDWSYEQEVRIVLPLSECRKEHHIEAKSIYIYNLPTTCIARVILGWNMARTKAHEIREFVGHINPEIEIIQARFVRGRVSLEPIRENKKP